MSDHMERMIPKHEKRKRRERKKVSSPHFAKKYPAFHKFCSERVVGDQTYTTNTVTIVWEDGVYKLCLNNRPWGRSSWLSKAELPECFRTADTLLATNTVRWRTKGWKAAKHRELF